jgi:hypothetical protein
VFVLFGGEGERLVCVLIWVWLMTSQLNTQHMRTTGDVKLETIAHTRYLVPLDWWYTAYGVAVVTQHISTR